MLQKIGAIIGILVFIFGATTYGSWYLASNYEWYDSQNQNGCLRLNFNVPKIGATTVSPKRDTKKRITTSFENGYPVLFKITNLEFKIPAFNQKGISRLTLGLNKITLQHYYNTSDPNFSAGPAKPAPIVFKRVDHCPN